MFLALMVGRAAQADMAPRYVPMRHYCWNPGEKCTLEDAEKPMRLSLRLLLPFASYVGAVDAEHSHERRTPHHPATLVPSCLPVLPSRRQSPRAV